MPRGQAATRESAREVVEEFALGFDPRLPMEDRLALADRFLREGRNEIARGRATSNDVTEREGYEKVFHALEEACLARLQKYGIDAPTTHDGIRRGLTTIGDVRLTSAFDDAFAALHVLGYYRGWGERKKTDPVVADVAKSIESIRRVVKRS